MTAPRVALATLIAVLSADAMLVARGRETVSEWVARLACRPASGALLGLGGAYLLGHLVGRPSCLRRYDPLSRAAAVIRLHVVVVP